MKGRTRFLITAIFLCHQLLAPALVTSQLPAAESGQDPGVPAPQASEAPPKSSTAAHGPCATRAATQLNDGTIICAVQQEKDGPTYKLHGDAEIHYDTYILRADEV